MASSQVTPSFPLLLLFLLVSHTPIRAQLCSDSFCRNRGPAIRFPFRITDRQPKPCGFPGFELSCNNRNRTILQLPPAGGFWVRSIDYAAQEIRISEPDECLPRRLLSLNLSDSLFMGVYNKNYMLFSCRGDVLAPQLSPPPPPPIACLSNSTHAIWATSSVSVSRWMATSGCKLISTISVPLLNPASDYGGAFSFSDLSEDLLLSWGEPTCGHCEARGGRCGFKSNSSIETRCFDAPRRDSLPRTARYAVTIGVGIPALMCMIGIGCYVCNRVKSFRGRRNPNGETASSTVMPQPTIIAMGLDGATIESYPKVVLGESRRLPQPDHTTCPICLSDYRPKETLRSMPECQHCFHAACIDEWLKLNSTCPVCRNSPTPLSPAHAT